VTTQHSSFLATRRGRLTLLLLCAVQFLAAGSLAGGLAGSAGMLIAARLAQGAGAALMAPAGLSILTTMFSQGTDRNRALGAWGAVSGLAAAVIALRATNTRGEPAAHPDHLPGSHDRILAPEPTD
jgi:MFS family permease